MCLCSLLSLSITPALCQPGDLPIPAGCEDNLRRRRLALFGGIILENRTYSDRDFFTSTKDDDVEHLRRFVISEIPKTREK